MDKIKTSNVRTLAIQKNGLLQNLIKGCKAPVFLYKFLFAVEKISNLEFIRGNFKAPQKSSKGTTFAQNKECFRRLPFHRRIKLWWTSQVATSNYLILCCGFALCLCF
ncbi:MAG: hypothetical protein IKA65_10935, partial [Lentisphaeria bacterium]|nr:hypothetical protein [Lentisphaeria bacterium]